MITAAGVSAGIDMALTLASRIAGEDVAKAIQLGIEYDPEPPFEAARWRRRARRSSSASAGRRRGTPEPRPRPNA